jgi:hypothetical protein
VGTNRDKLFRVGACILYYSEVAFKFTLNYPRDVMHLLLTSHAKRKVKFGFFY